MSDQGPFWPSCSDCYGYLIQAYKRNHIFETNIGVDELDYKANIHLCIRISYEKVGTNTDYRP